MPTSMLAIMISCSLTGQAPSAGGDLRGQVRDLADKLARGYAAAAKDPAISRVAVVDFDTIGDEAGRQRLGAVVAELLVTDLSRIPGVIVVERAKLERLIGELKLQRTAELDPRSAVEIGRFIGAGALVLGSVAEAGAQFTVNARQVAVETGAVIQAETVSVERAALMTLADDMVEVKSKLGAALRSTAVPGWGQLYNGDPTFGALFLGAGGLGAPAAGTFGGLYVVHSNRYHQNTPEVVDARLSANRMAFGANLSLALYAAIWVGNILHAYLSGADAVLVGPPSDALAAAGPAAGGAITLPAGGVGYELAVAW